MAAQFVTAVDLLQSLGITEPAEIDICAIAQSRGATVVEKLVTGCEARIVGYGERAIIVVNSESISSRKRFSAAHELGHWMRDAGTISLGCNPKRLLAAERQTQRRKQTATRAICSCRSSCSNLARRSAQLRSRLRPPLLIRSKQA